MIPPAAPLTPTEIEAVLTQGPAAGVALVLGLLEQVSALQQTVGTLTTQVAALHARLGQNSRNSHRPPSQDGPARPSRPKRRLQSSVSLGTYSFGAAVALTIWTRAAP